eukprot:m.221453 g.221453  ORF g.221453 m.221453 type:complete len:87 (+) comp39959_c0_seq63:708-968(+)
MNFPLPEENGPACLVKMYDEDGNYKVTDMLEVYGVLSVDPAPAQLASSSDLGRKLQFEWHLAAASVFTRQQVQENRLSCRVSFRTL